MKNGRLISPDRSGNPCYCEMRSKLTMTRLQRIAGNSFKKNNRLLRKLAMTVCGYSLKKFTIVLYKSSSCMLCPNPLVSMNFAFFHEEANFFPSLKWTTVS